MWLRDSSLPCAQSAYCHGQWCNKVGAFDSVGPSFPPASSDDISSSQFLVFVQHVNRFLRKIIRNPYRLLLFLGRIQKLGQKTLDIFHEA
ncbi:hypothetical protein TNCV_5027051 [Trichonephila clavipes]|nr:hypothetical protein TNCV_5027051 [Trichonephila clavipes]